MSNTEKAHYLYVSQTLYTIVVIKLVFGVRVMDEDRYDNRALPHQAKLLTKERLMRTAKNSAYQGLISNIILRYSF